MTANAKILTDSDKTDEIQIPADFKKPALAAAAPVSAPQIEINIDQEIEKVQAEVPRMQDESTKVFELRQAKLIQKIKELEARKLKAEKEINQVLQQKNTAIHDDLKKVANLLIRETKKFVPMEKEVETGLNGIQEMKVDIQKLLEKQTGDVQGIKESLMGLSKTVTDEYAKTSEQLKAMNQEKAQIEIRVTLLKKECNDWEAKKLPLQDEIKHLQSEVNRLKEAQKSLEKNEEQLVSLKQTLRELEHKREELKTDIKNVEERHRETRLTSERVEIALSALSERLAQKEKHFTEIERECLEGKKRLESLRQQEIDLIRSCTLHQNGLSQLKSEVASFEAVKASALKLQEESMQFFHERQQFYDEQTALLDKTHHEKMQQLHNEYERSREEAEREFQVFTESKNKEHQALIQDMNERNALHLKALQTQLFDEIDLIVKKQITKEAFESEKQRGLKAREELKNVMDRYFNQFGVASRPLRNWWMWSTFASLVLLGAMVAKYFSA